MGSLLAVLHRHVLLPASCLFLCACQQTASRYQQALGNFTSFYTFAKFKPRATLYALTTCGSSILLKRRDGCSSDDLYRFIFVSMAQQPPVHQALLFIGALWSHPAKFLWPSDQLGALTSAWQRAIQELDDHASGVIRTHSPIKRAVADSRLRPRDSWDRLSFYVEVKQSRYRPGVAQRVPGS